MPPRTHGPVDDVDEQMLDARINANKLVYPQRPIYLVAAIVAFQPVYYSHAINGMSWTHPLHLALYVLVTGATAYMLAQAYMVMVESEFWRRQRHFVEVQEKAAGVLRMLRLQIAIARTLAFLNVLFFALCTCLMSYIFRQTDARANYLLSPTLTAALLWFVSLKNEESRQRRMKTHK